MSSTIFLDTDGSSGRIVDLEFHDREIHRYLTVVGESKRPAAVLDALRLGCQAIQMSSSQGDLQSLSKAVDELEQESARIIQAATQQIDSTLDASVEKLLATLSSREGPIADLLAHFDPKVEGNVLELFQGLVSSTARSATTAAIAELSEKTHSTMEKLATAISSLERVVAVEEARQAELARGSAKGIDHEIAAETLLGELVASAGDSLDDVSTVPGLLGNKKGDKVLTPRGGVAICTEEKATARMTEARARATLDEAMQNRGAPLGILIVDDPSKVPGNQPFHLIDEDKAIVVAERFSLRLIYQYFRAKSIILMRTSLTIRDDARPIEEVLPKIQEFTEDIRRALDRFRLLKTEHTKASKAIAKAATYVDEISEAVEADVVEMLALIEELLPIGRLSEAS